VRQFNDLLRVLPPVPEETPQEAGAPAGLRNAAPSRPLAPAGRPELPPRRAQPDVAAGLLGSDAQAGRRAHEPVPREQPRTDGLSGGHPEADRRPPPSQRNGRQATNYQL
jgi:hypothetical protein